MRLDEARAWLASRAAGEEVVILSDSHEAASELIRRAGGERGAAFGWHRSTLSRFAAVLAAPLLVRREVVPIGRLAAEAVAARLVESAALGRFERAAEGPGLARALARTLSELRMARLSTARSSALARSDPELASLAQAYDDELASAGLIDRAGVFEVALQAAEQGVVDPAAPLGRPILVLDVALESVIECAFLAALASRSPALLATAVSGDTRSIRNLVRALATEPVSLDRPSSQIRADEDLVRMQSSLFETAGEGAEAPEAPNEIDPEQVAILSAPGESRECVEIARRMLRLAARGVPFDEMAILLRSPGEYRPHLEEALGRAQIPAHFATGLMRPDPAGRALLSLLACAGEGLSARRFAEYLSLGQLPRADEAGKPPAAPPSGDRWVAPDEELLSAPLAAALGSAEEGLAEAAEEVTTETEADAVVNAGTLRAPRRWERLLVEAAVIGGRERWLRRLSGLEKQMQQALGELEEGDPARLGVERDLSDLAALRGYALPLLDLLAALPGCGDGGPGAAAPSRQGASWDEWLELLSVLALRALRRPERVLAVLAELAPMAPIGQVRLSEVRSVLSERLRELSVPPEGARHGRVFVAPIDAARGLCFDHVFVPGLAEKLFPRRIAEDPILLDQRRRECSSELVTNDERVASERLALRIASGAARRQVIYSYPRLDLDQGRPRVPSFYALELLRAAGGTLPGFDELARQAEEAADARLGWPAPRDPEDAIDEAEHDLGLLERLLDLDPDESLGTARYLLSANPHLGRALRFRARRWLAGWSVADGLVRPSDEAKTALAVHALGARSYSPTALQNYSSCPYKFFLYAIHRLSPREVPEAIEDIDPLQRGSLVHEVQFELFGRLRDAGLLPVLPGNVGQAGELLDTVLDQVADRYRDDLAPAIERVWLDAVASVRADLREWLRRASEDASGFVPWRFELAFGLPSDRDADPHSTPEPVPLDCGISLRGSIDLVERNAQREIRVTDHKTGKDRIQEGEIISGGRSLQPVLYALVCEKLFPDERVESGRLYYCTAAGSFQDRVVQLDERARRSADTLAKVVGEALAEGFLPAAPDEGACRFCDYRPVCGPYEEIRTARKETKSLAGLEELRSLP